MLISSVTNTKYLLLIAAHMLLGVLLFVIKPIGWLYLLFLIGYVLYAIITAPAKNKAFYILLAAAYVTGVEVLLRMTKIGFSYEFSKYFVTVLMFMGLIYKGFSKKAMPYVVYLFLLTIAILVAAQTLGYDLNFRKSILFALSGPICLGLSAIFCYDLKITQNQLLQVLAALLYPIITTTTYLFLYTPSIKEVLSGTGSNFATSGGFGPNQVATVLGLGMFVLAVRFFQKSPTIILKIINLVLLALVSFRALVTFSRGGVITALLMIVFFVAVYFFKTSVKQKASIIFSLVLLLVISGFTWFYSVNQTQGLIENRYANQDALGREKADVTTGRADLIAEEFDGFLKNPFFGLGAGGIKQYRYDETGEYTATHNEVSRLLAEHGMLGIIILLILIFTPLVYRLKNKNNFYFYSFLVFWFATINHSSMRIAAPAFIYGLSILQVKHFK